MKLIVPYIIFFLISFIVCECRTYNGSGKFIPIEAGHINALLRGGGVYCPRYN